MKEIVARVGSLVNAQMSFSLRRVVSRYSNHAAMKTPISDSAKEPAAREEVWVGEGRRIGKVRRIHDVELLALLAMLKGSCHRRLVHFCEQAVVELERDLMIAGHLLVLFFDGRARLNPSLNDLDLFLNPNLLLLGCCQVLLFAAKLVLELE